MILVLGKARSYREPNLGCRGAEAPGWFNVSPKNSAQDVMHEQACCGDESVDFWIKRIVSTEEFSNLTQNLMQIHCSTHPVILNAMATQYAWSLKGFYCPPLTSTAKSTLFTQAHSSPLSLAVWLHQGHTNCSCYVNSDWTFSGYTLYI